LIFNCDVDNEEYFDVWGIDVSGALQCYFGNGFGDMYVV